MLYLITKKLSYQPKFCNMIDKNVSRNFLCIHSWSATLMFAAKKFRKKLRKILNRLFWCSTVLLKRLHKIHLFKLISGRCLVRFLVIVSLLFFRWKYENRSSCVFGPICIRVSEGHPPPHPKISHSHFTPHYSKKMTHNL